MLLLTTRHVLGIGLLILGPALALGQQSRSLKPKPVIVTQDPVTEAEAKEVFARVESAFRKVIPTLKPSKPSALRGNQVASRSAIVAEMDRLFVLTKPAFRVSPKPVAFEPASLTLTDQAAKVRLVRLVEWGCVNRLSPLAIAGKNSLTVLELGDAIGVFAARISELTHLPSDQFSPDRMKD